MTLDCCEQMEVSKFVPIEISPFTPGALRYDCKVVEVDWGELDILVHYQRWNNRFDEWLKMDSTRIRPIPKTTKRFGLL